LDYHGFFLLRIRKLRQLIPTDIFPFRWLTGNEEGLQPSINLQVSNHNLFLLLLYQQEKIIYRDFWNPKYLYYHSTLVICTTKLNWHIHFQGYLLGNPITTRREKNDRIPYAHGMGLISDELYAVIFLWT
jgi:hypothetical protein